MSYGHGDWSANDWIALVRQRDPNAAEELLKMCRSVCIRSLCDWPDVDATDTAYDVLIKIIRDIDRPAFSIRSSFKGYVYQTASRFCIDIKRRIRDERNHTSAMPIDDVSSIHLAAYQSSTGASRAELYRSLHGCIDQLAAADQQLILWSSEAIGPSEIARRLGSPITPNSLSVRLHRLRQALKRCLAVQGYNFL